MVFLGAAFLVACSLEDPARTPQGSSPTVQAAPLDASAPSEPPPRGSVAIDAGESANDASSTEDASEAGAADAEPPAASICTTYPNSSLSLVDGGPLFKRYFAIALQTMQRARGDCAIGNHFATYGSTSPIQIGCFANELMAEAGCTDAEGKELRYSDSFDPNNVSCAPADPGQDSVRVGFHNPKSNGVTNADLDRFLGIVEVVAVSSGQLAPEDAMRLKAALDAKRSAVVGSTAAGYSAAKDGCNVP